MGVTDGGRCALLGRLLAHGGVPDEDGPLGDRERRRRDVTLDASAWAEQHPALADDVALDDPAHVHVVAADVAVEPAFGREGHVARGGEVALDLPGQDDAPGLDVRLHPTLGGERHLPFGGDLPLDLPLDPEGGGRHDGALDPGARTDHRDLGALVSTDHAAPPGRKRISRTRWLPRREGPGDNAVVSADQMTADRPFSLALGGVDGSERALEAAREAASLASAARAQLIVAYVIEDRPYEEGDAERALDAASAAAR